MDLQEYRRQFRRGATRRARQLNLYDFSNLKVAADGTPARPSREIPDSAMRDLRGNLVAPDASRRADTTPRTRWTDSGRHARLSDKPKTPITNESSTSGSGAIPVYDHALRFSKRKYSQMMTDVFESPLLPSTSASDFGMPYPSADLMRTVIYLATLHWHERGQLLPLWKRGAGLSKQTKSSLSVSMKFPDFLHDEEEETPEDGNNQELNVYYPDGDSDDKHAGLGENPTDSRRKKPATRLNMCRSLDATAASAIGMIIQEFVSRAIESSMAPPVVPPVKKRRKHRQQQRYVSPTRLIMQEKRDDSGGPSRSPSNVSVRSSPQNIELSDDSTEATEN